MSKMVGMDVPESYRLDRGALQVGSLKDKPNDRQYWMSRTPAERFEALELLRQIAYGYDAATARLQRVLEVVEFKIR
jgi:hypothetical protein